MAGGGFEASRLLDRAFADAGGGFRPSRLLDLAFAIALVSEAARFVSIFAALVLDPSLVLGSGPSVLT